ncbi:MAG: PA2778 family cysteine peptidase [Halobacteria archaeon]|nr:PA2778 family cysteine peptidase [Halobacteria archaeon]
MRAAGALLALALGGCTGTGPVLSPHLPHGSQGMAVELEDTPFLAQTEYQCGPAALATLLQDSGSPTTPADLVPEVYLPARQGSLQLELIAATRRHGRLPYVIAPRIPVLLEELRAGRPVLVLQNLGLRSHPAWHYAVVIGYLPNSDEIILRSGTTRRKLMAAARFLSTWENAGAWGLLVLRPGELPARPEPGTYLRAAADLESVGQGRAASLAYAAATARWPANATAWFGLGNSHYHLGELEAAEHSYRQALSVNPGYLAAHNNLAMVLAERGCHTAALGTLDHALGHARPDDALRGTLLQTRREILQHQRKSGGQVDPACNNTGQQP